jgi:hypothetical protein
MLFLDGWSASLFFGIVLSLFSGGLKSEVPAAEARLEAIQTMVADFGNRLEITERIYVTISTDRERLVSVRRLNDEGRSFLITFDDSFVSALTEEELRAAVAHELGHVWIFTRRPYLQTEALANRKAAQLVPAESLEKLYMKVAEFGGTTQPVPTLVSLTAD